MFKYERDMVRILGDASSRVGAISRAHDRLYRRSDITRIELQAYLSDVCRDSPMRRRIARSSSNPPGQFPWPPAAPFGWLYWSVSL